MALLLALHVAVAAVAVAVGARAGTRVFLIAAVAPATTLVWLASRAGRVLDGEVVRESFEWVPGLELSLDFRLDGFGLLMATLISGIGLLVALYSVRYFSPAPGLPRFAAALTVFAAAMLGIVLADHIVALYVFWEVTAVTSFLLIGYDDVKSDARAAALQALLVTGAGGLAMLAGFVLLSLEAGTSSLSEILANPPAGGVVEVALLLVLLGAFTKSAQVPFHSWLPGAMAAPTPVSTYLHSATMVKAGVYLVARMAPAYADTIGFWRPLVMGVGIATMLVGGVRALRQTDLKLLLAYGTVSQLGFLVALFGAGVPELTLAAAALLLAHALFKASLFLVVGVIDHQTGTRDLRVLSGLGRRMPATFAVTAVVVASMAGLPPMLGFVAKEAALEGLLHRSGTGAALSVALVVLGSVLTFAYGARFLWGAFAYKPATGTATVALDLGTVRPPRPSFLAPAALLASLTLGLGVALGATSSVVNAASSSLDDRTDVSGHLSLWHGLSTPLLLSGLTVLLGAALFVGRGRVERVLEVAPRLPGAAAAYDGVVRGLNRLAVRTTGIVQNGSLPTYLGVILLTVLALPGLALAFGTRLPSDFTLAHSPMQLAVVCMVAVAAVASTMAGRRFTAVMFLGAVGFGVAVLFVIQGAPDLALTQLLVETLALVIFVLVLRHLPERFEPAALPFSRGLRAAVAGGIGIFVTSFLLISSAARTAPSVSTEYIARSLPEAGGRNIVNVILVDFRGLDTLGEITVLATAALGITSLIFAGRAGRAANKDAP